MNIAKILDRAIRDDEMIRKPKLKCSYWNGVYEEYIKKECWEIIKAEMEINYPKAFEKYGKGGGKELEERVVDNITYPPKMASFGSSSRMIYNLFREREKEGFLFEEKLSTTIGGKANLDGFWPQTYKNIYIEAKCREPYGAKNQNVSRAYEEFYKYITDSDNSLLKCEILEIKEKDMKVNFVYGDKQIVHFDMKQMLCHFLGIATSALNGEVGDKLIEFWYLLFNPLKVTIEDAKAKEKIVEIYKATCEECCSVDFQNVFLLTLEYLQTKKGIGREKDITDIAKRFSFSLCDQEI